MEPRPRRFIAPSPFPNILSLKGAVRTCHFETNFPDYAHGISFFSLSFSLSTVIKMRICLGNVSTQVTYTLGPFLIFTAQ